MFSAGQNVNRDDLSYTRLQFTQCEHGDQRVDPRDWMCLTHNLEGDTFICDHIQDVCRRADPADRFLNPGGLPECSDVPLQEIASRACAGVHGEERANCLDDTADIYVTNLSRVPESLKKIFEGLAQVVANAMFELYYASRSPNPLCSNGEINAMGGAYTFVDFLRQLADVLVCSTFTCLTGADPARLTPEALSAYVGMVAQCNCDGTPRTSTEPVGDGIDNGGENGLPCCVDLAATAVQAGVPCDPQCTCRPALTGEDLQYEINEVRAAYPDDPQTPANESDAAVNNYLERPVCEENDSAAQPDRPCCSMSSTTMITAGKCDPNC